MCSAELCDLDMEAADGEHVEVFSMSFTVSLLAVASSRGVPGLAGGVKHRSVRETQTEGCCRCHALTGQGVSVHE